jgi:hypothetical protein
LYEELGLTDVQVGRFLGTWELLLELADELHHEIAHIFEVHTGLKWQEHPTAAEGNLEFFWTELSEANMRELDVKPFLVPQVVPKMVHGDKPLWASGNRGEVRIKEEEAKAGLS